MGYIEALERIQGRIKRREMTEFDFTNHRPMSHHAPSELLLHLHEHLSWGRMHLDEYRNRHPNPLMHTTLTEIHYHIRQAMHWLDALPLRPQEDSHD
ncbi:MAG: hypothetical protein DDT33_01340 [Firmicutes bacterium]|nr:hypothetical protein [Bacillota bacterium]